jgi:hypothetical protein
MLDYVAAAPIAYAMNDRNDTRVVTVREQDPARSDTPAEDATYKKGHEVVYRGRSLSVLP